jgi:hypothetical protein
MKIPLQKPAGLGIAQVFALIEEIIASLWNSEIAKTPTQRAQESKPPRSFVPGGELFAEMLEKSDAG